MARIENNKIEIIGLAQQYVREEIAQSSRALKQARNLIAQLKELGTFDQTQLDKLKTDLKNDVKEHTKNGLRMYRWMLAKNNITPPAAFTDAEVDGMDINIRTHEE